jgi:hypothetical protein
MLVIKMIVIKMIVIKMIVIKTNLESLLSNLEYTRRSL